MSHVCPRHGKAGLRCSKIERTYIYLHYFDGRLQEKDPSSGRECTFRPIYLTSNHGKATGTQIQNYCFKIKCPGAGRTADP